jgi:hypothetical protein
MSKPMMAIIGAVGALLIVAIYFFWPGGSHGQAGDSDFAKTRKAQTETMDALSSQGGRVKEKTYPIGKAFIVDLSGMTISDKLLNQVKSLGNISELNLSKSTVTDEDLDKMAKLGLLTLVNKFDLSNTAVTDAGLEKCQNMIFLGQMNLVGTKCTAAGVTRFKRAREQQPNNKTRNPGIKLN